MSRVASTIILTSILAGVPYISARFDEAKSRLSQLAYSEPAHSEEYDAALERLRQLPVKTVSIDGMVSPKSLCLDGHYSPKGRAFIDLLVEYNNGTVVRVNGNQYSWPQFRKETFRAPDLCSEVKQ